jgi:excisionase family DNA binding protein
MPVEILRLAEAAERLGITTKEMVYLVHERKIRYVLVDGIARIPSDVLEEYRTQRAS